MHLWVDLANSPHIPFFRLLIKEFVKRGAKVEVTARRFAQTVELAEAANLDASVISGHGGRGSAGKAGNLIERAWMLREWARGRGFDLAVSHNSYSQIVAARALGVRCVTLMDYEHQPANHLAFRLASRVIVPRAFPEAELRRCGARSGKVRRYDGIKEDVYLADFKADPSFQQTLQQLGVNREDVLVVVRPPARDALYHRFDNLLFDKLLKELPQRRNVKVLLLPRTEQQRAEYQTALGRDANIIMPTEALDGANLIAHSDLVVSAGGTMNREAAALGVPAATIYAGKWAAIDEQLVREGRLQRLSTEDDLRALRIEKKPQTQPRRRTNVRMEIVALILEE